MLLVRRLFRRRRRPVSDPCGFDANLDAEGKGSSPPTLGCGAVVLVTVTMSAWRGCCSV